MSAHIHAAVSPGEIRVAVCEDGELIDFALWRPGMPDGVDDVYRGRVRAVAPSLAGCFVNLGDQDGFLPDSEGAKGLSEGDFVAVRITRAAQAGKGVRLSARGLDVVAGAPGLVSRGPGGLREMAALHPDATISIDDSALFAVLKPVLGGRMTLVAQAFDDEIAQQVESLFEASFTTDSGVVMHFEPTRALVAIDVDSGFGGGRDLRGAAHMALNRAMLPQLVRQIRLRDLAGTLLVDFAGLPAKKRAALGPDLVALLAADPRKPRLAGFTPMGLAEIVRARRHPPLHEMMTGPHASGLRALREAAARPLERVRLRALPPILRALEQDQVALAAHAHGAVYGLELVADGRLGGDGWVIETL